MTVRLTHTPNSLPTSISRSSPSKVVFRSWTSQCRIQVSSPCTQMEEGEDWEEATRNIIIHSIVHSIILYMLCWLVYLCKQMEEGRGLGGGSSEEHNEDAFGGGEEEEREDTSDAGLMLRVLGESW
ncbi:hypothetical protein Pcinc_034159 [Petrolisthes cinctipes]|uniref:Uncharacterized protein n=1 Tax=Petrolisthes cinctipes TaxID=88211 RepID=A0AAE1K0G7_PETCI|nr:hypothetical protein Pcinc_034159 [Petrolisthes cinctipes]